MVELATHYGRYGLDRPNIGLFVPAMIWCIQYKYSADAVLLVFATESYNPDDYIRDYDEFLALGRLQKKRFHGAPFHGAPFSVTGKPLARPATQTCSNSNSELELS